MGRENGRKNFTTKDTKSTERERREGTLNAQRSAFKGKGK
jgi:hypothetical protein